MNWDAVVTSLITSGAVATAVTFFLENRRKKIDHEWKYKQAMVDKRAEAYKTVEQLIGFMSANSNPDLPPKERIDYGIEKVFPDYQSFFASNIWLTPAIVDSFKELHDRAKKCSRIHLQYKSYLAHKEDDATSKEMETRLRMESDNALFKVYDRTMKLEQQYFIDMSELSDIDRFITERKTFYIQLGSMHSI